MDILFIGVNPTVKRLVELSASKTGMSLEQGELGISDLSKPQFLIIESELIDEDGEMILASAPQSLKKILIAARDVESLKGCDAMIRKPFLPTEVVELLVGMGTSSPSDDTTMDLYTDSDTDQFLEELDGDFPLNLDETLPAADDEIMMDDHDLDEAMYLDEEDIRDVVEEDLDALTIDDTMDELLVDTAEETQAHDQTEMADVIAEDLMLDELLDDEMTDDDLVIAQETQEDIEDEVSLETFDFEADEELLTLEDTSSSDSANEEANEEQEDDFDFIDETPEVGMTGDAPVLDDSQIAELKALLDDDELPAVTLNDEIEEGMGEDILEDMPLDDDLIADQMVFEEEQSAIPEAQAPVSEDEDAMIDEWLATLDETKDVEDDGALTEDDGLGDIDEDLLNDENFDDEEWQELSDDDMMIVDEQMTTSEDLVEDDKTIEDDEPAEDLATDFDTCDAQAYQDDMQTADALELIDVADIAKALGVPLDLTASVTSDEEDEATSAMTVPTSMGIDQLKELLETLSTSQARKALNGAKIEILSSYPEEN